MDTKRCAEHGTYKGITCPGCHLTANARIAELEAQLAEQKEWVSELADLNVKNEAAIADRDKRLVATVRKIKAAYRDNRMVEMFEIMDAALSDPVSR